MATGLQGRDTRKKSACMMHASQIWLMLCNKVPRNMHIRWKSIKGEGPSLSKLMERVASRSTQTPPQVACIVQDAVAGTPMYEESRPLHGDKETIQRKRFRAFEMDKFSHKPGYVMESRQCRSKKPIARRVRFEGGNQATMEQENQATTEQEG